MTLCEDRNTLGWHRVRFRTVRYQIGRMTERLDPDLIDYLHWARQLRGLSANTLRTRLELLARLARYVPVPLRQASAQHIADFERVAIAGRAAQTRRAYACHIRALYRWMLAADLIATDPSAGLTLPIIGRHLPRPISEEDLAVALAAARPKMRAMLTLEAYAGLRCAEVAALEWGDLRRERDDYGRLHVRGKGDKDRLVEVGAVVIRALKAYGIQKRGPVFLGVDGGQITPNAVSRAINRHLARCDVDATAHQLRHRYATLAYRLSKDARMVQEQLGHASADTTAIYTLPSLESASRMVAALDQLGLPAQPGPDPSESIPTPERTAS